MFQHKDQHLVYLVTVKRPASDLFCFVVFQWRRNMPSVSHTVFQRANFGLAFSSPTIFTEIESASTAWIFSQNVPRRMKKVRKDWALHWFICSDGILLLLPVCVLVWGVCFIRIIFVFVANISWKLWKLLVLIWRFSCVGSICWCEQKKFWIVSFFYYYRFCFCVFYYICWNTVCCLFSEIQQAISQKVTNPLIDLTEIKDTVADDVSVEFER